MRACCRVVELELRYVQRRIYTEGKMCWPYDKVGSPND